MSSLSQNRPSLPVAPAAAALLVGHPEWRILDTPRSGEQFSKTAEVSAKPAIAILSRANQNDDSAREYFADGLTQDIINALGRFPFGGMPIASSLGCFVDRSQMIRLASFQ
jgi:hypothetical protein